MKIKPFVAAMTVVLMPVTGWAQAPGDLGQRLAEDYVRPAVARLAQQSIQLEQVLTTWCDSERQSDARPVQRAFADTVLAWAGVEFLRFGPLVENNRYEKLAFWPDTRGVMPRQVRALLAKADPAVLAPDTLAARSVATQGLPALEYVLHDSPGLLSAGSGEKSVYACHYAIAVASNVARVSGELQQAWSAEGEFGRQFTTPVAENDLYRSQQEVAAEAVKALSTGLQFARDIKLLPVLGDAPQSARASRAAFWRSGLTLPSLAASLNGMRAFYDAGHYHDGDGNEWITSALTGELVRATQPLVTVDQPLQSVLADPAGWQRLVLVGLILKNTKDIVDQNFAPALGVNIGFNALDGD